MAEGKGCYFRFDRMEAAGSLGDLGTLLPLSVGMILFNGLSATSVFFVIGLFYVVTGLYFRVPVPVQPMKVIGAYAITFGLTPLQIIASSLCMGLVVLLLGLSGLIKVIGKFVPRSTVRGVQLGVGASLMVKGFGLVAGPDPGLALHALGPVHTGLLLGVAGFVLTFFLLDNRKVPAALVIIGGGVLIGVLFGKVNLLEGLEPGLHVPRLFPYGIPSMEDILWVIPVLVIPQLPMTIGNAIIANTDLTHQFFGERARRTTWRSVAVSQGLAGIVSFLLGGIPMCHGAGGLAAHYRFGARTAGSNLIIGGVFLLLSILLGEGIVSVLKLLPLSVVV